MTRLSAVRYIFFESLLSSQQGPDNSLGVTVSKQEPNVRCSRNPATSPYLDSCYTIFDSMPIDSNTRQFGPPAPGNHIKLPWTQYSGKHSQTRLSVALMLIAISTADGKCSVALKDLGRADVASWYEVWDAGTTVASMCAARGRGGVWTRLG